MNRRRKLIAATCAVLLLCVLLAPLARLLSLGDHVLEQKQAAIARALEMEKERAALPLHAPVQPAADIETIWAIEDARTETDAQLVLSMRCGADEMGYDAQSRTFYATLGLNTGDEWPDIALSAQGAENVQVVWVDDYTYDWCAEAIREGYRYELLAYTDTEYAYIGVVFTGLPIVTLHTEGDIVMGSDVPGRATVAAAGYAPVDAAMVAHERGGGWAKVIDKWSYRLEFHGVGQNGKDEKKKLSVLGMEPDSDWLLLANAQDNTTVRNLLAWEIWNDWHEGDQGLMCMQSELVELFVGDEYKGIYQLMERVKEEEEIARFGGDVHTDSVVRLISETNATRKPVWDLIDTDVDFRMEYRYEPKGNAARLFRLSQDYVALSRKDEALMLDDAAFEQTALERIDIGSLINYTLFFHACSLRDNIKNNVYLYLIKDEDGRQMIHHAPWDMDTAFWVKPPSESHDSLRWPDTSMILASRMLDLDVGGCRKMLWDLWNEKKQTVLSDESLSARIMEMEETVNASGAYLRETEKWYGGAQTLNLSELEYYTLQCLNLVRLTIEDRWPVENMMLTR